MFAANAYVIRRATAADADAVAALARLDSARPLAGDVLIGEIAGAPAAALALDSGRVVADPFRTTGTLVTHLRMRAGGIESAARTPSVRDRIRGAIRAAGASPVPGMS